MHQSPLEKPIISWEEFDRLFQEAFNAPKSNNNTNDGIVKQNTLPPPVRTASPEPINPGLASDTSADVDGDATSFNGFISEEEIPMYTPLLFPSLKKTSDETIPADEKLGQSAVISPFPKRPRVMSNQVSARRTISSAGSIPRLKRTSTNNSSRSNKPRTRVQVQTSDDGTTTTASIDVPDILKDSLNVDFHQDHLVVTWRTATITDKVLKDSMIRERKEKRYTQTVIVPDGTKFENVRAVLKGRTLMVSFPTNPKVPGLVKPLPASS
ncbi:hypothetical protein CPB86DRAFT_721549 [Serendipita vermifera]|nr:hypothetical protein CPB86DRAFT_721549 [Serendipita vermifera]